MNWRLPWVWAIAALVAAPLFYALSVAELGSYLGYAAIVDEQQLQHGFRWDFAHRDDLAGPETIAGARVQDSTLSAPRADAGDFVSLNLRGERIDARALNRLALRIRMERATSAVLFFRESLGGPDRRSPPLPLRAGWQELRIALNEIPWQDPGEPGPAISWGGAAAIVASLRLHPATTEPSGFVLDWIAVGPGKTAAPRERRTSSLAAVAATAAEHAMPMVLELTDSLPRPAAVMAMRQRLEQRWPASSVVFSGEQASPPALSPPALLLLLTLGLGMALAAWLFVPRPGWSASLALASIAAAAGALLLSSPTPGPATLPLTGGCVLLLLGHLLAELRRAQPGLIGTAKAWRRAALLTALGLTPLLVLSDVSAMPPPADFAVRWLRYLPWATLQQVFLCALLYRLCRRTGLPEDASAAAAALLFGLAHYPNFELMLGTFVLAGVSLALYRRQRSLAPLVAMHATLGTGYLMLLPADFLYSGAVGMRFFG